MPGCIVSATTASFRSVEKWRRRATPVITSTFENVSDIGVCLGACPSNAPGLGCRDANQAPSARDGELQKIVGCAEERPFGPDLIEPAEEKLPETSGVLDL